MYVMHDLWNWVVRTFLVVRQWLSAGWLFEYWQEPLGTRSTESGKGVELPISLRPSPLFSFPMILQELVPTPLRLPHIIGWFMTSCDCSFISCFGLIIHFACLALLYNLQSVLNFNCFRNGHFWWGWLVCPPWGTFVRFWRLVCCLDTSMVSTGFSSLIITCPNKDQCLYASMLLGQQ